MSGTRADDTHSPPGSSSISNTQLLAAQLFNETWRLMRRPDRRPEDTAKMIGAAHASLYHWGQVSSATPANMARGEWLVSRVYAELRRAEPALYHARRVLEICEDNGIGDWDLAFAYEALARAHAVAGERGRARDYTDQALAAAKAIAADGDRDLVLADLENIPHQRRYW